MTKKEMIELADSMKCGSMQEKFYSFAKNFIFNNAIKDEEKIHKLKLTIDAFNNNPDSPNVKRSLGVSGKNSDDDISQWCNEILKKGELWKLPLNELHYVLGCCERKCKIAKG